MSEYYREIQIKVHRLVLMAEQGNLLAQYILVALADRCEKGMKDAEEISAIPLEIEKVGT